MADEATPSKGNEIGVFNVGVVDLQKPLLEANVPIK